MKKLLLPILVVVFFSSCTDSLDKIVGISKPQLRVLDPASNEPQNLPENAEVSLPEGAVIESRIPPVTFPIERILTDVKGRTISAKVLAKKGNQIAIARIPSNQQFVLTLEMLAEADRVVLARIADGGDFASSDFASGDSALSTDRSAVWHSHINNAEKEASQFGIPLLVAVSNGANRKASAELEKTLVYSREFKKWADRNVVLCLLKVESGSRETTLQTWKTLAMYGIRQSSVSTVALINPGSFTSKLIPLSEVASVESAVSNLDEAILKKSAWASIAAAPAPRRQASPFKVSSRGSST